MRRIVVFLRRLSQSGHLDTYQSADADWYYSVTWLFISIYNLITAWWPKQVGRIEAYVFLKQPGGRVKMPLSLPYRGHHWDCEFRIVNFELVPNSFLIHVTELRWHLYSHIEAASLHIESLSITSYRYRSFSVGDSTSFIDPVRYP